ncbi:hypothetical protein HRbin06_01101 [archaeon HR06]|nr:hypothetical protein HRbin06_01101 [archaeon HR06]
MVVRQIRDSDIKRILLGSPTGKGRIRLFIETKEGDILIFEEGLLQNITRAYIWIGNHPKVYALEMNYQLLGEDVKKWGHKKDQFIESKKEQEEIQREIDEIFSKL